MNTLTVSDVSTASFDSNTGELLTPILGINCASDMVQIHMHLLDSEQLIFEILADGLRVIAN